MAGVDNRKQRGFVPQYKPGQYERKDDDNGVTRAPNREAGNGVNKGGMSTAEYPNGAPTRNANRS